MTTLCHGCDRALGPTRFCISCNEVMPVYEHEGPAVYADNRSRIEKLLPLQPDCSTERSIAA